MHPDRKIGFAMGILLVGVVGALFFRNEPLLMNEVPAVRREKELNEQLRVRDVAVYLEGPELSGSPASDKAPSETQWTLKELLKDLHDRDDGVPLPIEISVPSRVDPKRGQAASGEASLTGTADGNASMAAIPQRNDTKRPDASGLPPLMAPLTDIQTASPENSVPPIASMPDFEEYTVRYGDTLSQIAERFLGSQARFLDIYEINKDRLSAPDRLQIGKAIRIPKQ